MTFTTPSRKLLVVGDCAVLFNNALANMPSTMSEATLAMPGVCHDICRNIDRLIAAAKQLREVVSAPIVNIREAGQ